jgi:hypothetical protein
MATKQQVIDLHMQHPKWTCGEIAHKLGCSAEYVNACKRRYDLPIPRVINRSDSQHSILALGQAARAAGLTVEKIEEIGART